MTLTDARSIRSFDIFDTSIVRRVMRPDHLHWLIARRLRASGLISCDDASWHQKRVTAEHAERALSAEPHLSSIYCRLAKELNWSSDDKGRARSIEWEVELASLYPVTAVLDEHRAARAVGAEAIFISDTYFSGDELKRLLEKAGYDAAVSTIYASCDSGTSKASGAFFAAVQHALGPTGPINHLGDNVESDVVRARQNGIAARWFSASAPSRYERAMCKAGRGEPLLEASLVAGAGRAARLLAPASANQALWTVATDVAGPVLTSFVLWVLLEARRQGLHRLYFLARDGQVLVTLAKRLCAWAAIDLDCTYLLASRQAFFLASLPDDPLEALASALKGGVGKTAAEVLSELEFSDDDAACVLRRAGCDEAGATLDETVSADILDACINSPEVGRFAAVLLERNAALNAYFEAEGVFSDAGSAIVDLGWQGNLQLRIDKIFAKQGAPLPHGFYYDLYTCPPSLSTRVSCYAAGGELFNPHLLETFCKADHRSIRGFAFDLAGGVRALGRDEPDVEAIAWGVRLQQAGIEAYCRCLTENLEAVEAEALASALRPAARAVFARFIRCPDLAEAQVYGQVRHAADQRHIDELELAPRLHGLSLALALAIPARRRAITKWAGGLIARAADTPLGWCLRVALDLPHVTTAAARHIRRRGVLLGSR